MSYLCLEDFLFLSPELSFSELQTAMGTVVGFQKSYGFLSDHAAPQKTYKRITELLLSQYVERDLTHRADQLN